MPLTKGVLAERERRREYDAKRLAQFKRDKEVRPQIEAEIRSRDARWEAEDLEMTFEDQIRAEREEDRVRERAVRKIESEQAAASNAAAAYVRPRSE